MSELTDRAKREPDRARVFFGVHIDEDVRSAAVELQRQLMQAGDRVKWVEPENLHFTLRFIGDTALSGIPHITKAARQAAGRVSAFSVDIAGVGAFPSPARARSLWLGCTGGVTEFVALHTNLAWALEQAELVEPEQRPFTPHMTLGRVRERPSIELVSRIDSLADAPVGSMRCSAFSLIRSTLTGSGPVYEVLEDFGLTGRESGMPVNGTARPPGD